MRSCWSVLEWSTTGAESHILSRIWQCRWLACVKRIGHGGAYFSLTLASDFIATTNDTTCTFCFRSCCCLPGGGRCCCGKFYVLVRVCGGPIKGVAQASISYYSPAKNTGIEEIPKKPAPTSNSFKRTLLLVFLVLRPPSPHRLPCHGRGFCDRVYYSQLKITAGAWDWVTRGKAIINNKLM